MDKVLSYLAAAAAVLAVVVALLQLTGFIDNTLVGAGSEELNESAGCIGDAVQSNSDPNDCVGTLEDTTPDNQDAIPGAGS